MKHRRRKNRTLCNIIFHFWYETWHWIQQFSCGTPTGTLQCNPGQLSVRSLSLRTLHPLQMQVAGPIDLYFSPTSHKPGFPNPSPWVWFICYYSSQNQEKHIFLNFYIYQFIIKHITKGTDEKPDEREVEGQACTGSQLLCFLPSTLPSRSCKN